MSMKTSKTLFVSVEQHMSTKRFTFSVTLFFPLPETQRLFWSVLIKVLRYYYQAKKRKGHVLLVQIRYRRGWATSHYLPVEITEQSPVVRVFSKASLLPSVEGVQDFFLKKRMWHSSISHAYDCILPHEEVAVPWTSRDGSNKLEYFPNKHDYFNEYHGAMTEELSLEKARTRLLPPTCRWSWHSHVYEDIRYHEPHVGIWAKK